jgi:hypothetical protein
MHDNRTYRNDEVEGSGEEHVFSSSDESHESKYDDCMDETQNGDEQSGEQDQLEDSESEDEDMDISESEGTLRC